MRLVTKIFTGGVLFIGLLIAGFVLLLKGCLSKYDERYALPTVLYFEQPDKNIVFSIVKYNETTSYQQHNGFVSKSFDNHCFIQCNNAATGEKIKAKELKRPGKKNYNEEALGASGNNAWVFIDELMAFNAFTLEKVADVAAIEQKNPQLKGMLPKENRYYHFNDDKSISITVKDGSKWKLNTGTLLATPEEEVDEKGMDMEERERLSVLKNLQRSNVSYSDMFVNQDTVATQWFGLYSREEMQKLDGWIRIGTTYTGEARRQFFTTSYTHIRDNHFEIDKTALKNTTTSDYFLDGGFLLDRQTGAPVKGSKGDSYFIIFKSQVGNEGEIILTLVNTAGKVLWRLNSGLTSWTDWHLSGGRLLILGADNKDLGSSKCNVLISINTGSGQAVSYDYFTDKTRQAVKNK